MASDNITIESKKLEEFTKIKEILSKLNDSWIGNFSKARMTSNNILIVSEARMIKDLSYCPKGITKISMKNVDDKNYGPDFSMMTINVSLEGQAIQFEILYGKNPDFSIYI